MAQPTAFIIVSWRYKPGQADEAIAWREDSYTSLVFVAKDMLSGEIEDVAQVVYVNLEDGTSADWTETAYQLACDFSFNEWKEPCESLRDELDALGLEYYQDPDRLLDEEEYGPRRRRFSSVLGPRL